MEQRILAAPVARTRRAGDHGVHLVDHRADRGFVLAHPALPN
jgi:hypothetical protein